MRYLAGKVLKTGTAELLLVSALLFGCGAGQGSVAPVGAEAAGRSGSGGTDGSNSSSGSGGAADVGNVTPRCHAPDGQSGSPRTIEEAVALLNALPKPTSVACFVESLDRPLLAYATSSTISGQPALSFKSPRVFLRLNQLLLSLVIDGKYSWVVEFSYLIDNDKRSIKGELEFPIATAVAPAAPYERIRFNDGTVCGACHGSEERAASIDFATAFSSLAFRPNLTYRVPLDSLVHETQICDPGVEPERCQLLSAIFAGGQVSEAQFSNAMTLFY